MALTAQIIPADSLPAVAATADTAIADTAGADSLAVDTVAPDTVWYLLLEPVAEPPLPLHEAAETDTTGMSWVLTLLLGLFVIVAVRFRKNSKYLAAMFKDAFEVRERGNVFDETVREESFMGLLNVLWCLSVAILLYTLIDWAREIPWVTGRLAASGIRLTEMHFTGVARPLGMAICAGMTILWQAGMAGIYTLVGNVFGDAAHTRMWLTGYLATTGLSTLIFFPLALLAICYPDDTHVILAVALGGLIMAKLVFIWKGFRIFFRDFTSWLLFLYYLCSLEIVPLILLFVSCLTVCATIL